MRQSDEKFLGILDRHGIPTDNLEKQTVAMHREGIGGNETVTIYGVGSPIPLAVLKDIEEELIPLLRFDAIPGCRFKVVISDTVLPAGAPAERQAGWNEHCTISDPDGHW